MRLQGGIARLLILSGILLFAFSYAAAQGPSPAGSAPAPQKDSDEQRGFTLYEFFGGSSNNEGQVMTLTTTGGYAVNRYFRVDVGVPIYFVRAKTTTGTTTTSNGIGDVFTDFRLTLRNPVVNYAATLTVALPSGDTEKGRSTGRATFDWSNQFSRGFGRWIPFANLGVGNSLYNTSFLTRPFLTLGKVAHFEAGTWYRVARGVNIGASAYDVAPWGEQKVFSRIVTKASGGPGGAASHGRVFENNPVTTGGAELVRDNGFTAGLNVSPARFLDLGLMYSRSMHFRLDTISFGLGINLTPLFRRAGND
jgi:hypothetical protein